MERAIEGIVQFFLNEGLSGIIILILLYVVWKLFTLLQESKDGRLADYRELAKEQAQTYQQVENAITNLATYIKARAGE